MSPLEISISHFFLAPYDRKTKRYRSKRTGRFTKTSQKQTRWRDALGRFVKAPEFYRATYACNNVPIENRLHHFSVSVINLFDAINMDDLKEALLSYMEIEIGYSRDEWWFEPFFGIESPSSIEAEATDYYEQHRVGRKS